MSGDAPVMTRGAFRVLLDATMALDPSPLPPDEDAALRDLLDREAEAYGYEGWIDAFHSFAVVERTACAACAFAWASVPIEGSTRGLCPSCAADLRADGVGRPFELDDVTPP